MGNLESSVVSSLGPRREQRTGIQGSEQLLIQQTLFSLLPIKNPRSGKGRGRVGVNPHSPSGSTTADASNVATHKPCRLEANVSSGFWGIQQRVQVSVVFGNAAMFDGGSLSHLPTAACYKGRAAIWGGRE